MENSFTKKMASKSDAELQAIITNKSKYQEDAYIAAIEELEHRKLAPEELSLEKQELIEEQEKEHQIQKVQEQKGNEVGGVRLYKDRAFWVGTFLGGPLVAGYLFSENFKSLGQAEKVKSTWIITVITTVVIFGLIFMIPDTSKIPNQLFPIIYTAIVYGIFKKVQEEQVTAHINRGGLVYGWGRVILIGIIGTVATMILIFSLAFLYDSSVQANITTKKYGINVKHEIDYDNSNISEVEVDRVANGLIETGFFDLSVQKYVFLHKDDNTYEIYIASVPGVENNTEALYAFQELRQQMDRFLPNNKVEIKLVVDNLENVVKVLK